MTRIRNTLYSIFLFSISGNLLAQDMTTDGGLWSRPTVLNCETNLVYQDLTVNAALAEKDNKKVLIVIVHAGDAEDSQILLDRRLYNLRQYFNNRGKRLGSDNVVIGTGERVNGLGRVDYYVGGKLYMRLFFPNNGYICHSCCGPDDVYYPDKAKTVRKKALPRGVNSN